jgi:hypothetical protein
VVGDYESFFSASAGASAAILGLLVVAVSVVNADDADPRTRELRTVLAGSAFVVLVDIFFVSIVALTGGLGRPRVIERRNGRHRPAGHPTADTEGKTSGKLLPYLPNQEAQSRLRVGFGRRLLSAARPRRSAPDEHPECRAATCSSPRDCGLLRQRPGSDMGGHRNNPAEMTRLDTGIASARDRGCRPIDDRPDALKRRERLRLRNHSTARV